MRLGKFTVPVLASILILGIFGFSSTQEAYATTITLLSGNGALGTSDLTITMLIGPVDTPFNVAFVPADFASAINPPSAQIVVPLDFAWVPNPGPNG